MRKIAAFLDPFILALLCTVLLASVFPAIGAWREVVSFVGKTAIVLLFFLHGAKLPREAILDGVRHWRLHTVTLALTFCLFPLLGMLSGALDLVPAALGDGLLFLTLLPSTVQSSIAFTSMARGNVAAAVCGASFSNVIGIFATPLLVALLIDGGGSATVSGAAVQSIVLQLLLPFAAGHMLRPWIGGMLNRSKALITLVDRGSILTLVYGAFGAAVLDGLWQRVSAAELIALALICSAMLVVVMVSAWCAGRLLGFSYPDRIVLLFCGSKKSLASGVPMASVLFPPAMVGMIILPLMLFHQIQLIICALIARRLGACASMRDDAAPASISIARPRP